MLKWLAFLLVTTVLCWGDTGVHSTDQHSQQKTRPIVNESVKTQEISKVEELSDEDKKELSALIDELGKLESGSGRLVGEDSSPSVATTPNL